MWNWPGYGGGYGRGWRRGRGGPPEWVGRGMGWGAPGISFKQINPPPPGAFRVACAVLENRGLDSPVSPRFARAPFIAFVDIVNGRVVSVIVEANPAVNAPHGAGVVIAQWLLSSGVRAVLAVRLGPNIMSVLQSAGIQVYYTTPGIRLIDALRSSGLVR